MATSAAPREALSFDPTQARWVLHVPAPLVAVVGEKTLLGRILCDTRAAVRSAVRDADYSPQAGRGALRLQGHGRLMPGRLLHAA